MSKFASLEKGITDIALRRNDLSEGEKTLMRIITNLCREEQKLEAENTSLREEIRALKKKD